MFSHIIGNQKVKDYLTLSVNRGMISNSLLFAGPDGIGKSLFAEAFAKLLICQHDPQGSHKHKIETGNHPDIRIYRPEGKIGMHTIASMREFNEEVYSAPYEARWKVFIVRDAERMLSYSANALLKTFEEPAKDTIIILVSSSPAAMLPTVLSRCRKVFFQPLSNSSIASFIMENCNKNKEESDLFAHMAQGSLGKGLRLAKEGAHPARKLLLDSLSNGKLLHYKNMIEIAAEIAERIDAEKKEKESEFRKQFLKGFKEDLTAFQKQSIEKEIEGAISVFTIEQALFLFEILLSWYRDIHLVYCQGNLRYIIHQDYLSIYPELAKKEQLLPLEDIEKMIGEAKLSLERSTSLQICLENLFLKLTFNTHLTQNKGYFV